MKKLQLYESNKKTLETKFSKKPTIKNTQAEISIILTPSNKHQEDLPLVKNGQNKLKEPTTPSTKQSTTTRIK